MYCLPKDSVKLNINPQRSPQPVLLREGEREQSSAYLLVW